MTLSPRLSISAAFVLLGILACPAARAQMGMPGGRSLGGYGAATIGQYYVNSGMSSYMPYNGNASGFVPYRGGAAGGLGVAPVPRRLPQTSIGGIAMPMTPIGGSSLSRGMASGTNPRSFASFGYEGGIGLGAGMIGSSMTGSAGMRSPRPGPGLGYPFRMPPDLLSAPTGMPAMGP